MKTKYIHRILSHFLENSYLSSTEKKIQKWLIDNKWSSEKNNVLHQFWNNTPFTHPDKNTYRAYNNTNKIIKAIKGKEKESHTKQILKKSAMMFVGIALLTGSYLYFTQKDNTITINTANKEKKQLILSDGTTVLLHSDSKLIYPSKFCGTCRQITLEGEAYFTVKKTDDQPFVIKAGALSVIASEAKFGISAHANNDKTIATLRSGCIMINIHKIREDGIKYILTHNQQITYDKNDQSVSVDTIFNVTEHWKDDVLLFEEAPFNDIINTLKTSFRHLYQI